jgi:hypothetical protein
VNNQNPEWEKFLAMCGDTLRQMNRWQFPKKTSLKIEPTTLEQQHNNFNYDTPP